MSWFWYKSRSHSKKTVADWNAPLPDMAARDDWRLEALYAWERRLRGYDLYPSPVSLEPVYVPYDPDADAQSGGWGGVPQPRDDRDAENRDADDSLLFLTLRLPLDQKITPAQGLEFLTALRSLSSPVSLELLADARSIRYQIACVSHGESAILAACSHCFPLARIEIGNPNHQAAPDALLNALTSLTALPMAQRVVDFGLYHPAYRPLKLFETFTADPHGALIGALGSLKIGEVAGVQMLVAPAQSGWGQSLALLVEQFDGVRQPAHPNTPDTGLQRSLRYKLASPLWAVGLRVFAFAAGDREGKRDGNREESDAVLLSERATDLCRRIGATLDTYQSDASDPEGGNQLAGNQLVALDDAGYESRDRLRDLLDRRSRRAGMLLSQAEIVGLWHPPSERVVHPRLFRYDPRRRELPDYLQNVPGAALGVLALDENSFSEDEPQIVRWPDAMRNRHLYMLGATRMGKSTLLLNLIAQDMMEGRGLCLIDPHGDLAIDVLHRVPPGREEDVYYLDLSDTTHPPALGLLEAPSEWEKRLLVSDLLAILHRLFRASWGDRLEHILRHALLTLLAAESSPFDTPLTLRDIRPLLSSQEYRHRLLERVPDPDLHTFWASEFPGYTSAAFAPVYNKLGLLMSSPVVRNIIGGAQTKLHAGPLMRDGQILLVNLAQSLIGEDNAHFLGALLVSKIQLAAMHNLRLGREERSPFTLYVDEFQNFVVSSFEKILSEAGKAGLTLVMANQFLEQLGENLPTAIRSNTGTLISFRVSAQSGRALEGEFGGLFGAKELTDLERGQAVARLGRAGDSFLIHTFPPLEPQTLGADRQAAGRIQERTHESICRERPAVEAELRASDEALRQMLDEAAAAGQAAKEARKAKPDLAVSRTSKARAKNARPPASRKSDAWEPDSPMADDSLEMEAPDTLDPDEKYSDGEGADADSQPSTSRSTENTPLRPSRSRQPASSRRMRGRTAPVRRAANPSDQRGTSEPGSLEGIESGGAASEAATLDSAKASQITGQGALGKGAGEPVDERGPVADVESTNHETGAPTPLPTPPRPQPEEPAPTSSPLFFGLPEQPSEKENVPENDSGETQSDSGKGVATSVFRPPPP